MILDVNGVGYEVYCSGGAFAKVGNGDIAELYTYLQAKEDGMTLFGFASPKEKELFLKLISVSGVGPKMGIAVLSALSGDDFAEYLLQTKGAYAYLGTANPKKPHTCISNHRGDFDIDEETLPLGTALYAAYALSVLDPQFAK